MNEELYIQRISSQLKGIKKTSSAFNFKCPFCEKDVKGRKQRGYLYRKDGKWSYYCHNCFRTHNFKTFLKIIDPVVYQDYALDNFTENDKSSSFSKVKVKVSKVEEIFKKLTKISSLRPDHPAKKFIVERQIPTYLHHDLRYCKHFKEMTNELLPEKFKDFKDDEPRIVIPIYKYDNIVGYQGRAIGKSDVRYITIVLNEEISPLVWNSDNVEWNAKHYIFEGVFDACYVPNSIAVCGSALLQAVRRLNKPKNYSVLIFDNESRNKHNVKAMMDAVKEGYRVCVFPDTFKAKDVNEHILDVVGKHDFVQSERIKQLGYEMKILIDQNTYFGLQAELKIADWSKS